MSDEKKQDAPTEDASAKKNKKIKFMDLKEIEKAIEKTSKEQGGLYSKYAYELVKRRDYLSSM